MSVIISLAPVQLPITTIPAAQDAQSQNFVVSLDLDGTSGVVVKSATNEPDFDTEVLIPLRAAQAEVARKIEAERIAAAAETARQEAARAVEAEQEAQRQAEAAKAAETKREAAITQTYAVSYANNYSPGQCTWYVASKVPVPSSMGNATAWEYGLRAAGWSYGLVNGAVGVSHEGWAGHVVFVEGVTATGVLISEMNYNGGVGIINRRTVPATAFAWLHR